MLRPNDAYLIKALNHRTQKGFGTKSVFYIWLQHSISFRYLDLVSVKSALISYSYGTCHRALATTTNKLTRFYTILVSQAPFTLKHREYPVVA